MREWKKNTGKNFMEDWKKKLIQSMNGKSKYKKYRGNCRIAFREMDDGLRTKVVCRRVSHPIGLENLPRLQRDFND